MPPWTHVVQTVLEPRPLLVCRRDPHGAGKGGRLRLGALPSLGDGYQEDADKDHHAPDGEPPRDLFETLKGKAGEQDGEQGRGESEGRHKADDFRPEGRVVGLERNTVAYARAEEFQEPAPIRAPPVLAGDGFLQCQEQDQHPDGREQASQRWIGQGLHPNRMKKGVRLRKRVGSRPRRAARETPIRRML